VSSTPDPWQVVQLGDVAELNPGDPLPQIQSDARVSFVPMSAVSEVTASIQAPEFRRLDEVARGFTRFREGDVLLARITPSMENGKVAIANKLEAGVGFGSTEFHVIRPGPRVTSRWLWYFLRQPSVRRVGQAQMTGSAGQQRVPPDAIRALTLPLPPNREMQDRICDLLDDVDAARRLRFSASAKVAKFKDALFNSLFGREAITAFQWNSVALSDVRYCMGLTYGTSVKTIATLGERPQPGSSPVLRIPNVLRGTIDPSELKYAVLSAQEADKLRLRRGDILIVRSNGNPDYVGRSAVYRGDPPGSIFASYLIRLRPNPRHFESEYLSSWLGSPSGRQEILQGARTTSGVFNLSAAHLSKISVPLPPLEIQRQYAEQVEELREIQKLQRKHQSSLDSLFYSLIAEAFKGRLTPNSVDIIKDLSVVTLQTETTPIERPLRPEMIKRPSRRISARPRLIWHSLSQRQRYVWFACKTFKQAFTLAELRKAILSAGGNPPNSEHLRGMLELLVTLGVIIQEERDGEFWRWPLPDIDEEVAV